MAFSNLRKWRIFKATLTCVKYLFKLHITNWRNESPFFAAKKLSLSKGELDTKEMDYPNVFYLLKNLKEERKFL